MLPNSALTMSIISNNLNDLSVSSASNDSNVSNNSVNLPKDQIFRKVPSDEVLEKILNAFGLKDIDDQKTFSRNDLKTIRTVEKLNAIKPELEVFYIPCKARTYLSYIDEKTAITILRQFVKTRNRMIESREKYMKGYKFLIYYIVKAYNRPYKPVVSRDSPIDITFDNNEDKKPYTIHFD
jgi:hypothetical protein